MDQNNALKVINDLKKFAANSHMGFIIVGSVAYRSALKNIENFQYCDDLDCIFVYSKISDIVSSDFVDNQLLDIAKKVLTYNCDLFSTKKKINDINLSIDFISLSYLCDLNNAQLDGVDKYRLKLTDAIEVQNHIYCDWFGNELPYTKEFSSFKKYRIYKLPIHLFCNNNFFAGVLITKFLFNPVELLSIERQSEYIKGIQKTILKNCPPNGNVTNLYLKKANFSKETIIFLLEGIKE